LAAFLRGVCLVAVFLDLVDFFLVFFLAAIGAV
jgi:hypothetical protein